MAQPSRSPIPSMSTTYNGQWQTPSSNSSLRKCLLRFLSGSIARWLYPSTSHKPVDVEEKKSHKILIINKKMDSKVEKRTSKSKYSSAAKQGAQKLAFSLSRLPFVHPLGRIGTYMCANGAFPLGLSKGLIENMGIAYEGLGAGLVSGIVKCGAQFIVISAGEALLRIEDEDDPKKREDRKCSITIASGLLSEAAAAPPNYLKTLQNITKEKQGCLQILRQNGIAHMMNPSNNGTGPMLARNFFWIVPFAYLRGNLNSHIEGGKVTRFVIAAISGGAACVVSYPMESIRIIHAKNLQTWLDAGQNATKPNYVSTLKALAVGKTVKEIAKPLFRGLGPAVAVMALQGVFIAGIADWNDRAN